MSVSPPQINILALTNVQFNAHLWLLKQPDLIHCPRGILMRLKACEAMQASRRHFIKLTHETDEYEGESVRADFLVCQHCEHYHPHTRKIVKEGHTEASKQQDMKIRAFHRAEVEAKRDETNRIAEEQRRAKETAIQKSFTSRDKKRAEEIEARFSSTLAKLQAARKAKSEKQSERQKTRFQVFREKERERRETRKATDD
ncbi:MAG: hypothetical protein A2W19_02260 [Spirochaetes bacterium RBG_16_49_21]|nr:MAG: hypothetical protein A2W19_02260 [Spirochaetes bacterium RBG_16_49_21]